MVLVDGNQRISQAIKFLTMSSWSHSAIYVGDALADFEAAISVGVPFVGRVPIANEPPFPTDRCVGVMEDLVPLAQLVQTRHEATSAPSGNRR